MQGPLTFEDMNESEIGSFMTAAARGIKATLPPGTLFVLLAFNDPAVTQYVSNANRSDVIQAMQEAADRFEAREEVGRDEEGGER